MEHTNETKTQATITDKPTMANQPSPSHSGAKFAENLDRPAEGAREVFDDDAMARSESFAASSETDRVVSSQEEMQSELNQAHSAKKNQDLN